MNKNISKILNAELNFRFHLLKKLQSTEVKCCFSEKGKVDKRYVTRKPIQHM